MSANHRPDGIPTTSFLRRQLQRTIQPRVHQFQVMPSVRSTTQQQRPQRPQPATRTTTRNARLQRPQRAPPAPSNTPPLSPDVQQISPQQHKAFPFVSEDVLRPIDGLHRPVGLVILSALVLETAVQLTGVGPGVPLLAAGVGAGVGGLYAGLNRMGVKRLWTAPTRPLNVVITGSTKGIGKALAREFLRCAYPSHCDCGYHHHCCPGLATAWW